MVSMIIFLFILCILLVAVIVFLNYIYMKERKTLLDRIMAENYREYKAYEEKIQNIPEPESPLTDEEEAELELRRKGLLT